MWERGSVVEGELQRSSQTIYRWISCLSPEYDEAKTVDAVKEIGVQVNGKVRGSVEIATDATKEEALAAAREAVAKQLEGKTIVKEIYVPGKILNFVVK